ncbi:MAG TPA: SIS domain-containing protein, partial [Opitutaceae bacterium]|nr:SIS domain-containing protein [Opitutaceae bacterium]
MASPADQFYARATALLESAREKNQPVIAALAPLIGANLAAGGMLHVFGSGHSEV